MAKKKSAGKSKSKAGAKAKSKSKPKTKGKAKATIGKAGAAPETGAGAPAETTPDSNADSPKKTGKKSSKKGAGKGGEKADKKPGKKGSKKGGKKAKKAESLDPKPVKTGKGASPAEVGEGVVAMVKAGAPETEIWDKYFSRKLVSVEGAMGLAWHGRPAVRAKADWWYSTHKVHSVAAEGPYIGATGFGVKYTIDAEEIETGNRMKVDELAFYTVRNGKVIQEEFMGMKPAQA